MEDAEAAAENGDEAAATPAPAEDAAAALSQAHESIAVAAENAGPAPASPHGIEDCARIAHAFDDLLARLEAAEGRFARGPADAG